VQEKRRFGAMAYGQRPVTRRGRRR